MRWIVIVQGSQFLERDEPLQVDLPGEVNDRHPAATERTEDLIMSDRSPDLRHTVTMPTGARRCQDRRPRTDHPRVEDPLERDDRGELPSAPPTASVPTTPETAAYPWAMSSVAERLTADDYLALEDPRRTELIDGTVVVNEPTVLHQHVAGLFYLALAAWPRAAPDRGTVSLPLDVRLDDATVLAPDVLWFAEAIDLAAPRAPRMPDLAVEVRLPGTWVYDVGPKRERYERHGLRELWLADTASGTLLISRRSRRDSGFDVHAELTAEQTLASPLLPGFTAPLGELIPALG